MLLISQFSKLFAKFRIICVSPPENYSKIHDIRNIHLFTSNICDKNKAMDIGIEKDIAITTKNTSLIVRTVKTSSEFHGYLIVAVWPCGLVRIPNVDSCQREILPI